MERAARERAAEGGEPGPAGGGDGLFAYVHADIEYYKYEGKASSVSGLPIFCLNFPSSV